MALSLMHSSPKTYRLLRRTFALPSIRTLRKVMNNIDIYPSFNAAILNALRLKLQSSPSAAKLVCIAMDEMSIKEGLSYDGKRALVEESTLANHVRVFLVKGLIHRWKQPFGYFYSSGPISGSRLKVLLFEAIQCLQAIGLTVIVVVSDQGSNNVNLYQTQLQVTVERPFFM